MRKGGRPWGRVLAIGCCAAALFALNAGLYGVLFLPGESPYRDSIEAGYASMGRFFALHPSPWGWNPLQYCGLPAQFWYLPVVPYLTALWIHLLPFLKEEHVFRLVVTAATCLGPATLFIFAFFFTRSLRWALLPAALLTFFSPSYFYFAAVNTDRGGAQVPWRMQTLIKYGEGPHNTALTLLPLALVALVLAGAGRKYRQILVAAILLASIALTNWVGAMSLGWCSLMLLLTLAGSVMETGFLVRRTLAAAGLAYLLACFWLTPTFIWTTAFNWPTDAFNYQMRDAQRLLLAGLLAGVALIRLLFVWIPKQRYLCFLMLCFFSFAYVVCCHYWFDQGPIPESRRYALEAEMFLFLLLAELLRQAMRGPILLRGVALGVAAFALSQGASQVKGYLARGWSFLKPFPREQSVEYQTASFIASRNPRGRIFVTGGTRFRWNSWFDLPQVGGTFESGLRNRASIHLRYAITSGLGSSPESRGPNTIRLLRALGVEYVGVHGQDSREHYRDLKHPGKFEGLLEKLRDGADRVYRLPFAGYANLVHPEELPPRLPVGEETGLAEGYVAAMDDPARPLLRSTWLDNSRIEIRGAIPDGMLITVRVAYDEGWQAWQDGRPLAVAEDTLEFLLLKPVPSRDSRILLAYAPTAEAKGFAALSAAAWLASVAPLAAAGLRKRRRRSKKEV